MSFCSSQERIIVYAIDALPIYIIHHLACMPVPTYMNVSFLADDAKNRTFSEIWMAREHPHSVTHLLTSALLFILHTFFDCKQIHAVHHHSTYKAASCLTRALNRRYQIDQLTVHCATPVDGHHGSISAKKHARLIRASFRYHCAIKHPEPWALIFSIHATGKIYLFCFHFMLFSSDFSGIFNGTHEKTSPQRTIARYNLGALRRNTCRTLARAPHNTYYTPWGVVCDKIFTCHRTQPRRGEPTAKYR
jgi:hypothetical protein